MEEYLPEVQALVAAVKTDGWRGTPNPLDRAIDLALAHPERVILLAEAVMAVLPKGGVYLDAALSFLPSEDFAPLVTLALAHLAQDPKNEAAESVIAYASLQCLSALHPHLEAIFVAGINGRTYYHLWPWREAGPKAATVLQTVYQDETQSADLRRAAWQALLEIRDEALLRDAYAHPPVALLRTDPVYGFHEVGYAPDGEGMRRLYPAVTYHVQFGDGVPDPVSSARETHPTWHLPVANAPLVPFGGEIAPGPSGTVPSCASCGKRLDHLLTLDPVPEGLGVTGLSGLTVATCLSCLGWEQEVTSYRHDEAGQPTENIGYEGGLITPQFPANPLAVKTVRLAATPERWRWQDWGLSNSRENLNRVGGYPCWIQSAQYPSCPGCDRVMPFLLQLDSGLEVEDTPDIPGYRDWLWGSGGITYVHWCDRCKISTVFWQCT